MQAHQPINHHHTNRMLLFRLSILLLFLCSSSLAVRTAAADGNSATPEAFPSIMSDAERMARNERRYPGENFPPGFDVGDEEPLGKSGIRTLWLSPSAVNLDRSPSQRTWLNPHPNQIPTLMLNMLVFNEEENLNRTLPIWRKTIDYWIIGVDAKNSDRSVEIIKHYLGDLPGEIAEVTFDGIGPTWSQVVRQGITHFPQATFGILADADHAPVEAKGFISVLDRTQLGWDKNKVTFRTWNDVRIVHKTTDWIYRNIPGARLYRRCHHYVEVPFLVPSNSPLPPWGNVNFDVDENTDLGVGERMGNRDEKYIRWLTEDLIDYPNDARSIYYRAHSHYRLFLDAPEKSKLGGAELQKYREHHLRSAIADFERRIANSSFPHESWIAHLMLVEIAVWHRVNETRAVEVVNSALRVDPERAEQLYMLAQFYARNHRWSDAERQLHRVNAEFKFVYRDFLQWPNLWNCQRQLDYACIVYRMRKPSNSQLEQAIAWLRQSDCSSPLPSSHALDMVPAELQDKTALLESLISRLEQRQNPQRRKRANNHRHSSKNSIRRPSMAANLPSPSIIAKRIHSLTDLQRQLLNLKKPNQLERRSLQIAISSLSNWHASLKLMKGDNYRIAVHARCTSIRRAVAPVLDLLQTLSAEPEVSTIVKTARICR